MGQNQIRSFFVSLLMMGLFYILFIQTEKYPSTAIISIRDLSQNQSVSILGSMLLGQTSTAMQDSKLLELYIKSEEMFKALDAEYNLTNYYTSDKLDLVQRLTTHSLTGLHEANIENLLERYNKDIVLLYDEPSATLSITFLDADADRAKQIVQSIIAHSTDALNRFEKENAKVALGFLQTQESNNKQIFMKSIQKLIAYQNAHNTIDPQSEVTSKSGILANLESELVQKEVEYSSKERYMKKDIPLMQQLQATIDHIKEQIHTLKNQLAGSNETQELNTNVFDFELLKNEADFNKEVYKQTLIKLEETKVMLNQNAKNLIIITKPAIAQTYAVPNKPKDLFTLLIVLGFLYGIVSLVLTLLREHKD